MDAKVKAYVMQLGVFIAVLLITLNAYAAFYDYTTLDVPDAYETRLHGINNAGQIVGSYTDTQYGKRRGFIYSNGVYEIIDVPGTYATDAYGINDAGDVVGVTDQIYNYGFIYSNDSYETFDVPGAFHTYAYDINNAGDIVGRYTTESSSDGGFLYNKNSAFYETSNYYRWAINDTGDMVTRLEGNNYLYKDSVYHEFYHFTGYGINNACDVVGDYNMQGRLYSIGIYETFNVPGAYKTFGWDINDAGDIVGFYEDASGIEHGFLATSVPIPSTMLLLGAGLFGLVGIKRKGFIK